MLSIYQAWFILACAIKLGQINLLLWARVSSDFISGVIKSWDRDKRIKIVVSYYGFIFFDDIGIYMDEM